MARMEHLTENYNVPRNRLFHKSIFVGFFHSSNNSIVEGELIRSFS